MIGKISWNLVAKRFDHDLTNTDSALTIYARAIRQGSEEHAQRRDFSSRLSGSGCASSISRLTVYFCLGWFCVSCYSHPSSTTIFTTRTNTSLMKEACLWRSSICLRSTFWKRLIINWPSMKTNWWELTKSSQRWIYCWPSSEKGGPQKKKRN